MDRSNAPSIQNGHIPIDILDTKSGQNKKELCIAILGTGNYGRALAIRFKDAGLRYCIGSRSPRSFMLDEDENVMSYEEAVFKSDVIFLAVPWHAYDSVIEPIKEELKNKIVVDISNLENKSDPSNALQLQAMLPDSFVMKALNTVSAYALESDAFGGSRVTYVCGDDMEKKGEVISILKEIGLAPIDRGQLSSAKLIEKLPFNFFNNWITAVIITLVLTALIWFFIYFRSYWYGTNVKNLTQKLPLTISNRILAWASIWLLCLTYLPGILAGFIQIISGTKYKRFPNWMDRWMKARKQLGLISLLLAVIHTILSFAVLAFNEIDYMMDQVIIPHTTLKLKVGLNIVGQVSLLFATLSLTLMTLVSITSLPSVNVHMSWKEWDFIQGGFGFTSLIFAFVHLIVISYNEWQPWFWKLVWGRNPKGVFPNGVFIMALFPVLVMALKFILMLPGISCHLSNIRKGKVGYKYTKVSDENV